MQTMAAGLQSVVERLHKEGKLNGICGMGGTGGTAILSTAFRALPVGVPKLIVSTVAGTDVSGYVGSRDITMMPSIVDIAGINRISRPIYINAAAAIAGMTKAERHTDDGDRPLIGASMFGNTTACIDRARSVLEGAGYEVLTFHATGTGGRTMQSLSADGLLTALLDVTTTELADEVCGGIFTAGPERVHVGAIRPIPVVLAPGCVDMCNFGPIDTTPAQYRSRQLYEWNSSITLMRTNVEENRKIGELLAQTANNCAGPVSILLPLRGVSMLDSPGGPFWNEEADSACYASLRAHLRPGIPVVELDVNINEPLFADTAANTLFKLMNAAIEKAPAAQEAH